MRSRFQAFLLAAAALFFVLSGAACSKKVGDSCNTNVLCSPLGDRFCDLSSPGGYCTIEGCDELSCPDEAVCVRFFTLQRGTPHCSPDLEARADCTGGPADGCCLPGSKDCCRLGERCLCDDAACANSYCVSETSERRWCMKKCDSDSDCREAYQCFTTGQRGAIAVATRTDAGVIDLPVANYCAPALQ